MPRVIPLQSMTRIIPTLSILASSALLSLPEVATPSNKPFVPSINEKSAYFNLLR